MQKPWLGLLDELENTVCDFYLLWVFVWMPPDLKTSQGLFPLSNRGALIYHLLHFFQDCTLYGENCTVLNASIQFGRRRPFRRQLFSRLGCRSTLGTKPWQICVRSTTRCLLISLLLRLLLIPSGILGIPLRPILTLLSHSLLLFTKIHEWIVICSLLCFEPIVRVETFSPCGCRSLTIGIARTGARGKLPNCFPSTLVMIIRNTFRCLITHPFGHRGLLFLL
mmetsp:Transcript_57952/g.91750  ORF Transcript_57952/g.91750 Transcript_57952/m.91750 type:complete len:223 (-) Transcript_57952:87-755(-)